MALINCSECNKEISRTVSSCPNCGSKKPFKGVKLTREQTKELSSKEIVSFKKSGGKVTCSIVKKTLKVIAGTIFGLYLIIFITNISNDKNIESGEVSKKTAKLIYSLMADDYRTSLLGGESILSKAGWYNLLSIKGKITAKSILKDFKRNEVYSIQKYKGYWHITGKITGINDTFNGTVVTLDAQDYLFGFNSQIDDKSLVASYNTGDSIELICDGTSEAISLVYGDGCQDYDGWINKRIKYFSTKPSKILDEIKDKEVKNLFSMYFNVLGQLKDDSTCYSNLLSEKCKNETEELLLILLEKKQD